MIPVFNWIWYDKILSQLWLKDWSPKKQRLQMLCSTFVSVIMFFKSFILPCLLYQYSIACDYLVGPISASPCSCTWATQLLLKKCCSGGELLATPCPMWLARDLNLRPSRSRDKLVRSTVWPTGLLIMFLSVVA